MISISILLLISVSIDCRDWCPYVKPNGTYRGLGIYHQFRSRDVKESDYVMFNRAGDEWIFNIIHNGSDKYDIHLFNNTVKHIESNKGVVFRFALYGYGPANTLGHLRPNVHTYRDCTVRKRVKISYFWFFQ